MSQAPVLRRPALLAATLALLSSAALAQDPLKTLPNNYKLIFDNPDFAVIRAHYGAHEKIPVHDHTSFSTVFVYLNNAGQVRIDHAEPGEKPVSVVRPPTAKGAYRVAPGIVERHSIENLGDQDSDFLRVELKRTPLTMNEPFRGKAPASLTQNLDVVEFSNPSLSIERIVCTAPAPCPIKAQPAPSLLIPIDPSTFTPGASHHAAILIPGSVHLLPATQAGAIAPAGSGPAQVLRLLLPASQK